MISDNNNVGSLINRNTSFLGFSFNSVKHCLHILFCRSLISRLDELISSDQIFSYVNLLSISLFKDK